MDNKQITIVIEPPVHPWRWIPPRESMRKIKECDRLADELQHHTQATVTILEGPLQNAPAEGFILLYSGENFYRSLSNCPLEQRRSIRERLVVMDESLISDEMPDFHLHHVLAMVDDGFYTHWQEMGDFLPGFFGLTEIGRAIGANVIKENGRYCQIRSILIDGEYQGGLIFTLGRYLEACHTMKPEVVPTDASEVDEAWRLQWEIVHQGGEQRDLRGVDLSGSMLFYTNLRQADLRNSNLTHASLGSSDLRGADLRGAILPGTGLGQSDLRGVLLDETTQIDPKWRLVWEIMNEGRAQRDLQCVDLSICNLAGADLRKADLSQANLEGTDLIGADLNEANLSQATLKICELQKANLQGANLSRADLSHSVIEDVNLSGAKLSQANLYRTDLNGTNLAGADLTDANLSEALYNNQTKWPAGFDPVKAGAILIDD